MKVDDATMVTFLKRYGVNEEQIRALPLNVAHSNIRREGKRCSSCNKKNKKYCPKCPQKIFCSQECLKKGCLIHKLLCGLPEAATLPNRSVQALFLPQDDEQPQFVWLPIATVQDEDGVILSS
jgi:hypothetical protein